MFQALELAPNYLHAHVQLAEISISAGRISQAIDKYDMLAETAEVRRDLPKAISFYRQALRLGSDDVTRRAKLISVLVQAGQLTDALAEYLSVGQALEAAGQYQKAADKYTEGLSLAQRAGVVGETVSSLQRQLGSAFLKLREDNKALAIYQELLRADPNDEQARYVLTELYLRTGQSAQAETQLNALLERYADAPEEAERTLALLAEAFPDEIAIQRRYAQTTAARGGMGKAIEILDSLGDHLLNAGRRWEAVQVIEDIIALNPPQVEDYRRLLTELEQSPQTELQS